MSRLSTHRTADAPALARRADQPMGGEPPLLRLLEDPAGVGDVEPLAGLPAGGQVGATAKVELDARRGRGWDLGLGDVVGSRGDGVDEDQGFGSVRGGEAAGVVHAPERIHRALYGQSQPSGIMPGMTDPETKPTSKLRAALAWFALFCVLCGGALAFEVWTRPPPADPKKPTGACHRSADCIGTCEYGRPFCLGGSARSTDPHDPTAGQCRCNTFEGAATHRRMRREPPRSGCTPIALDGGPMELTDELLDGDDPIGWRCPKQLGGGPDGGGIP